MLLCLLSLFMLLYSSAALADAPARVEPRIPLDARWTMPMEQVERLPDLERAPDGSLKASYTVRGSNQIELVTRWQGRAVSFLFAKDFGLYAISVEMVPQATLHSLAAADQEMLDLEQCAPIRLAVMRKYGSPQGLAASWDAAEVTPLPVNQTTAMTRSEAGSIAWPYARNWLIWEGQDTRLALGEQSVWYVSQAGLVHREEAKQELEREALAVQERDMEQRAQRQQELEQARQAVPSRAEEWESLF